MKKKSAEAAGYAGKNRVEEIGAGFILILTFLFSLKCALTAMTGVFSFDGGIMAQGAQNMAKSFRFATSYADTGKYYGWAMTIGMPVVLPIAILFKIFGESFTAGLSVNAIYMILLFLAIAYYIKDCLKLGNFYVLFGLLLFYGTKDIFDLGFGIYGELPMLFYILSGIIIFHKYLEFDEKKYMLFAGVSFGLAFMTKVVSLIAVPAFIFAVIWDFFIRKRAAGKIKLKKADYGVFVLGFFIPAVINEIYQVLKFGLTVTLDWFAGYLHGTGVNAGIVKQGGMPETYGVFLKYGKHLDILAKLTDTNRLLLTVLIYGLVLVFLGMLYYSWKYLKKGKIEKRPLYSGGIIMMMALALSYIWWWLILTPTGRAWYRRIVCGAVLYDICLVFIVYAFGVLLKKYIDKFPAYSRKIFTVVVYMAFIMIIFTAAWRIIEVKNHEFPVYNTAEKSGIIDAGKFISKLPPEAQFYGFAWWQAPDIAFASGKVFKNIINDADMETPGDKHERYLVVDRWAMKSESVCYVKLTEDYENQLVFSNKEALIYKLNKRIKVTHPEECN